MAMNKLNSLFVFVNVVESGGFSAAAKRLNVSASSISKTIGRLEDALGAQLVNRSTRSFSLTQNGHDYYERCSKLLAELEDADNALKETGGAPTGHLRVVSPISFGRVTIIPELPEFFERYPEITLEMHFSDTAVNIIQERFDIAIRTRDLEDSNLIRRVLSRGPTITVASPAFLARYGTPQDPNDLPNFSCLTSAIGNQWWFRRDGQMFDIKLNSRLTMMSGDALREAAVAGLGIAHSTHWLFRKDISEGTLMPILTDYDTEDTPISAVYAERKHIPQKVVVFIEFLKEIMARDGG